MQAQFQSPLPGPRTGCAFSSDFKNRIWPNQNSTICAQGPDWAWLKWAWLRGRLGSSNNNNNWHRHRYALCLPLRALSTLLRALHLL